MQGELGRTHVCRNCKHSPKLSHSPRIDILPIQTHAAGDGGPLTRLKRQAHVHKAQQSGSQPRGPVTRSRSQAVRRHKSSAAQQQQHQQVAGTRKRRRAADVAKDASSSSSALAAGGDESQPQHDLAAVCLEDRQLLQRLQQLRMQQQQAYSGPACRTRKRARLQAQHEQQQLDQIGHSMEQLVAEILTRTDDEALPYQVCGHAYMGISITQKGCMMIGLKI